MRVLLSAYSFGAGRGSEAGVGWNVARGLAERGHEVTVVTTSEFHHLNAPALEKTGLPIRLLEWDCGIVDFPKAASYRCWQRKVCKPLRALCSRETFDLVHHITFNQYRHIHDVFCTGLPYVIGPVGGAETVAPGLLRELPPKLRAKEWLRYVAADALPLGMRVRRAAAPGLVIASNPATRERLRRAAGIKEVRLMPIISVPDAEITDSAPEIREDAFIFSDAGPRPEKGARLLLRVLSLLWGRGCRVPVCMAAVCDEDKEQFRAYAATLGLPEQAVRYLPFMKRQELMQVMAQARLFISVGFRDSGCMTLLEALAHGLPVLCLETTGQYWLRPEYGTQVPIVSPGLEGQVADALLRSLAEPPATEARHVARAAWLHEEMGWNSRISQLEQLYAELLGGKARAC